MTTKLPLLGAIMMPMISDFPFHVPSTIADTQLPIMSLHRSTLLLNLLQSPHVLLLLMNANPIHCLLASRVLCHVPWYGMKP